MKILLLSIAIICFGCQSTRDYSEVNTKATTGDCEQALQELVRDEKNTLTPTEAASTTSGKALSLSATGAGFVADSVLMASQVALATTVCTAYLVVDVTLKSKGADTNECFSDLASALSKEEFNSPGLGDSIYNNTDDLTRAGIDLTPISKAIREVAACYQKRQGFPDKLRSYLQLKYLKQGDIYTYLPREEQQLINTELNIAHVSLEAFDQGTIANQERDFQNLYERHFVAIDAPISWEHLNHQFLIQHRRPTNFLDANNMCKTIDHAGVDQWKLPSKRYLQETFFRDNERYDHLKRKDYVAWIFNQIDTVYSFRERKEIPYQKDSQIPLLMCVSDQ